MYDNSSFLQDDDYIDALCRCICRQKNLNSISLKGEVLTESAVYKILEACSKITSLSTLPKQLFEGNLFLESV